MYLCTVPNQTFSIFNLKLDKILSIRGNEIIGTIGQLLDGLLVKKSLRKCKVIGKPNLGERLLNGTYTGNLGLLQKGEADLYLIGEARIIKEDFINYGYPYITQKFNIIQWIKNEKNNQKANDMLNNFNFGLSFVAAFIVITIISLVFAASLKTLISSKRQFFLDQIKLGIKRLLFLKFMNTKATFTVLTTFLLFYQLHLWFIKLMILNNIKTNKVIIDTSILIKSLDDAFKTKRILCFLEGGSELNYVQNTPWLKKLSDKKSLLTKSLKGFSIKSKKNCILEKSLQNLNILSTVDDISSTIFLIASDKAMYSMYVLGMTKDLVVWIWPIVEVDLFIMKRNERSLVDYFDKLLLIYLEHGIQRRTFRILKIRFGLTFYSNKVFRNIEEYMTFDTKFDQLTLENFEKIFIIYFCYSFLICTIFLIKFVKINFYSLKKSR